MADAKRRGRPSKLTPDIRTKICETIAGGNFREVAAEAAGVPLRTFYSWMRKGKAAPSGAYAEFVQAVLEAERGAEIRCVRLVLEAAAADPRHAQWWLERKYPERWSAARGEIAELRRQVRDLFALVGVPAGAAGSRTNSGRDGEGPGGGGGDPRRAVR